MQLHGVLHDGESQTRAAVLAAAALVDAHETLEELGQVLVGHPFAVVVHPQVVALAVSGLVAVHRHLAPVAGMRDGVLYQVAEDGIY